MSKHTHSTRAKRYHYLLVRDAGDFADSSRWGVEFGAYDKQDVVDERDAYREDDYMARDLKIVSAYDTQQSIDQIVEELNA